MENFILTSSKIQDFLDCQFYFYQKHINTKKILKEKSDGYISLLQPKYFIFGSYIHKVIELYLKDRKDIINIAKKQLMEYNLDIDDFLRAKKILKNFLTRDYLKYKLFSTEKEYHLFLSSGVHISGTIDAIFEIDKNTLLINDIKNNAFMNQSYLEKRLQFKIYALIISNLFPKYKKIIFQVDALQINNVFQKEINSEWFEGVEDYLECIYKSIINKKEKEYIPNFNSICNRCEFYPICPLMQKLDLLKINPIENFKNKDIKYLATQYLEYNSYNKIVNKNLNILKDILSKIISENKTNYIKEKWGEIKYNNNKFNIKIKE